VTPNSNSNGGAHGDGHDDYTSKGDGRCNFSQLQFNKRDYGNNNGDGATATATATTATATVTVMATVTAATKAAMATATTEM
jgi:hypothetical protein